jgi:hypothetical protein
VAEVVGHHGAAACAAAADLHKQDLLASILPGKLPQAL